MTHSQALAVASDPDAHTRAERHAAFVILHRASLSRRAGEAYVTAARDGARRIWAAAGTR